MSANRVAVQRTFASSAFGVRPRALRLSMATARPVTAFTSTTGSLNSMSPILVRTAAVTTPVQTSATTDIGDVKNGPLAKAGQNLIAVYQALGPGGTGSLSPSLAARMEISGSSVGVNVRGTDLNATVATMTALGMQIRHRRVHRYGRGTPADQPARQRGAVVAGGLDQPDYDAADAMIGHSKSGGWVSVVLDATHRSNRSVDRAERFENFSTTRGGLGVKDDAGPPAADDGV